MVISLASIKRGWASPMRLWSVTPQATSILCRSGAFLAQPWLAIWTGRASGSTLPIGRLTGTSCEDNRRRCRRATLSRHQQPGHRTGGTSCMDGTRRPRLLPTSAVRVREFPQARDLSAMATSWMFLNGHLDRQMTAMLRVDWPWLPFSPPERSSAAGLAIAFLRYCCSKWRNGRTPRACSNHVLRHSMRSRPRANHSRSGCDHARIGDSTVEGEGEGEGER